MFFVCNFNIFDVMQKKKIHQINRSGTNKNFYFWIAETKIFLFILFFRISFFCQTDQNYFDHTSEIGIAQYYFSFSQMSDWCQFHQHYFSYESFARSFFVLAVNVKLFIGTRILAQMRL